MSIRSILTALTRHLRPAMGPAAGTEVVRAGLGAGIGIGLVGLLSATLDRPDLGVMMIAPFGASGVLLFAVPNSPLAQPWSAIVGNTVSAVAAMLVIGWIAEPVLAAGLAVGLAISLMVLVRALHPPGGAVALTVALFADQASAPGWLFPVVPVLLGTVALVLLAVPYAHLTGRRYPFRSAPDPNRHGTRDIPAMERLSVSRPELAALLQEFRQSTNIGVEDLARVIAGAEKIAARHHAEGIRIADIMSVDIVSVPPEAAADVVIDLFVAHGFTSLPVVDRHGAYIGLILQLDVLRMPAGGPAVAATMIRADLPVVTAEMSAGAVLPLLAGDGCHAVPVLLDHALVGIVTQTDLLAALAKEHL